MSMKRNLAKYLFLFIFVVALAVATLLVALVMDDGAPPPYHRAIADFNTISSCVKTYKINAGRYPTDEQGLRGLVERPTTEPLPERWVQIVRSIPLDPWGSEYQYHALSEDDPRGFELRSLGKDKRPGTKDDLSSLAE